MWDQFSLCLSLSSSSPLFKNRPYFPSFCRSLLGSSVSISCLVARNNCLLALHRLGTQAFRPVAGASKPSYMSNSLCIIKLLSGITSLPSLRYSSYHIRCAKIKELWRYWSNLKPESIYNVRIKGTNLYLFSHWGCKLKGKCTLYLIYRNGLWGAFLYHWGYVNAVYTLWKFLRVHFFTVIGTFTYD